MTGPCLCGDPYCQRCFPGNNAAAMDKLEAEEERIYDLEAFQTGLDKITEALLGRTAPDNEEREHSFQSWSLWHKVRGDVEEVLRDLVTKTAEANCQAQEEDAYPEPDLDGPDFDPYWGT